jgi:hypothetical protein
MQAGQNTVQIYMVRMNHSWMGRLAIVFIPTQTLCLRQQEKML